MTAKARYRSSSSFLQIFLALLWGSWLGFTPTWLTLQVVTLIVALTFLRLPLIWMASSFAFSWIAGAFLLDPLMDKLGVYLLRLPSLDHFWTEMAKAPVLPWTQFNNSMVLGSFLLGILTIPWWAYVAWNLRRRAPLR
ncbi:MAG: hypothetical protein EOP10_21370 [Proteobacteria bacterium]|nr:MAG: hypothetical protein EOP10_21370 [Pseudomonadota bacterium]